MFNFNVSINLNSLGANITIQNGSGDSILRPGRGIILIPLQVLDCPKRESARCTLGDSQRTSLYLDVPLD